MTDGEPEPFQMSTDPGDERDGADDAAADGPGDETPDGQPAGAAHDDAARATTLPGGVESIDDLIDEASRTAADQAIQAATGTAPVDRSSDVWGAVEEEDDEDLDALWSAAADRHRGSHVFDDVLGPDGDEDVTRLPPPAADPTRSLADEPVDDEPEVFTLPVDDEQAAPASSAGSTEDRDATARADAAEDDPTAADDPEPFRFAAGPASTAPAEVPDHVPTGGRAEPDVFAFAFSDDAADGNGAEDEPDDTEDDTEIEVMSGVHAADDGAAAVPTAQEEPVSEEPEAPDDDAAWTFDIGEDQPWEDEPAAGADDEEEATLAERAQPRSDAGWNDLSDEPATWSLDPIPTGDEDGFADAADLATSPDPGGFSALLDDLPDDEARPVEDPDDGFLPDDQPLAPTREPDPPFQTDQAALGDVIDDLLGDLDAAQRPDPAAAPPATPDLTAMPPPAPTPSDVATDPPDGPVAGAMPPPDADDGATPGPPPDAADELEPDEPEDQPEPETSVGLTFASKPKKRGLFGR